MSPAGKARLRVLVADDHPSVRENLRYLIDAEDDLECVGVARDGAGCLRLCRELSPDVLILDVDMPGAGGLALAARVVEMPRPIRVVIYTLQADVSDHARRLGVAAWVTKDAPYETLLRAVRGDDAGFESLSRPGDPNVGHSRP